MTKEDIEFLKDLQYELNTQENDGNADPLYWGIMERKEVPVPDGWGEISIYDDNTETSYSLEEYVKRIDDYFEESLLDDILDDEERNELTHEKKYWDEFVDKTDSEDIEDFVENHLHWDISICNVEEQDVLCQNIGAFLTKRAAKEYIQKYAYNHSKPRTYAMTAYRNFELEHLLKILKTMDISQLKID